MSNDLISREALKREFETLFYNDCGDFVRTERLIDDAPTIEERPKGKWEDYTDDGFVECPFCGSATTCDDNKDELHYCYSCGAELT